MPPARSSSAGRGSSSRGASELPKAARTPSRTGARPKASRPAAAKKKARRAKLTANDLYTLVAVGLVGLVVLVWAFYPVLRLASQEQQKKARFERELADARKRNAELREEVARLKTPAGVEQAARTSQGLVRPGENLYVVTSRPATETSTTVKAADAATGGPLWQRILTVLTGAGR